MQLLSNEFLSSYPNTPKHMNEMAQFVFYRTYSRWLPSQNRRETWKEAVARAVDYNASIALTHLEEINFKAPIEHIKAEAETLFDNIFNLKQFLSGRTHWVGGAESGVAHKFPLANFNCSFIDITKWEDICDLFYLLLIGVGVGFKCTKAQAVFLPPIRNDFTLIHSEYKPLPKEERLEHTKVVAMNNGYAKIYIGDSKEGWVEALRSFFNFLTDEDQEIKTIKISYNSIRPHGERLNTFGGTASGHEPLKEMFEGIEKVLKGTMDSAIKPPKHYYAHENLHMWRKVRPIHILDIGNLIGNNVVVGGVRRTAEIFLCDADDWECILAKYGINGIWDEARHAKISTELMKFVPHEELTWLLKMQYGDANVRPLHHRRMSNNSIAFNKKPDKEMLDLIFLIMQGEGEPGLVNLESANKRRPNVKGINPCAEILLDSYGVCNLTTVNVAGFVIPDEEGYKLDFKGLMEAQALSTRAGIRMTCLNLELLHWNKVHHRDRLIGCSLTGWKDAMAMLKYTTEQEEELLNILSQACTTEAIRYCHVLRITTPLLDTTIKPEGTLSQVANGVSSGLHSSYAPYFIRRIRINAKDPLALVAKDLGWEINPEVGTPGETFEEQLDNARTLVISFPIKSGSDTTRKDFTAKEQIDNYFMFQEIYTSHNSSNTISVKPNEWNTVRDIIFEKWDDFIGVSFLAEDGGSYPLSPYEEIDEKTYNEMTSNMKPFDPELIKKYESGTSGATEDGMESCESGICPIR